MEWNNLKRFKFWSQKVLPLVYDDSLSYYEVLCKVVDYINKMLENEQSLYDMFEPFVSEVNNLKTAFEQLQSTVNQSLLSLNERCDNIENTVDHNFTFLNEYIDNINDGLNTRMRNLEQGFNSIVALCNALGAQIKSGDSLTLLRSKQYTDAEIIKLKKQLISLTNDVLVIDPIDGQLKNIQIVIDELFEYISFAAFTCHEFDSREYTCAFLDSIGYTALEFDVYGKWMFILGDNIVTADMLADFVKREELEEYALESDVAKTYAKKTDLIVYNPVNGFKNTIQQVIDTLVSFHACGNNCYTLDGLELTVSEFESKNLTAFEFDFLGVVHRCGLYTSPVTGEREPLQMILNELAGLHQIGITCTEFDALNADCDTIDAIEFTAYDFDFNGLVVFANAGYITVTTGVTATQYQNFVVDVHGFVRVLDLV